MNTLFALLREECAATVSLVDQAIVSHILIDWAATVGACTELSLNKGHVDDQIDTKHAPVFAGI